MKKIILLTLAAILPYGAIAQAAPVTDVIQAPSNYFVPSDAQKYSSPYYRYAYSDWEWTHNAIAGTITSATLNISSYDVDYDSWSSYYSGERDAIYVYDGSNKVFLGNLPGIGDTWSYASFTLGSQFFDDINSGLKVFMDIDSTNQGWAVTLAKSVLSVDGGEIPNPNPGTVPEPSTVALLGLGLAGIAVMGKRKRK